MLMLQLVELVEGVKYTYITNTCAFLATSLLKEKGCIIEWPDLKDLLQNQASERKLGSWIFAIRPHGVELHAASSRMLLK